jgi:hypothetical protein
MGAATNPAIELLVSQVDELERKANAYRASVNVLCAQDGIAPIYPDLGGGGGGGGNGGVKAPVVASEPDAHSPILIRGNTFYGKPQQTAVREFLIFRKNAGLGPAKPGEILDGLKTGGYQVQASSDEIALVGLRAMLRKRNTVFHKLPNGAWGLPEWDPNAKPSKSASEKASSLKDGPASKDEADGIEDAEIEGADDATEAA